jgi:hypothetical protein
MDAAHFVPNAVQIAGDWNSSTTNDYGDMHNETLREMRKARTSTDRGFMHR